jgi:hypothetical protein
MKTRDMQAEGMETRSSAQGDLTEIEGQQKQKKLHHRCSKSMEQRIGEDKDS